MRSHRLPVPWARRVAGAGALSSASSQLLPSIYLSVLHSQRFQSSSRFTRSGASSSPSATRNTHTTPRSGPYSAGRSSAAVTSHGSHVHNSGAAQVPLSRVKDIQPIRSVAQLQEWLSAIRSATRTAPAASGADDDDAGTGAAAPIPLVDQDTENQHQHLLRRLLAFSVVNLPPEERHRFNATLLLQVLQATVSLQHASPGLVCPEESGLVRELAHWLELDLHRHLAVFSETEETNARRDGAGADSSLATRSSEAGILLEKYVNSLYLLTVSLGAQDMEQVALQLSGPVLRAMQHAENQAHGGGGAGQSPSFTISDAATDTYFATVLAVMAAALRPGSRDPVAPHMVNVRALDHPALFSACHEMARRLSSRLTESPSASFVQEKPLVDVLLFLAELTGMPPVDALTTDDAHSMSTTTATSLGVMDGARRRAKQAFLRDPYQKLVGAVAQRVSSQSDPASARPFATLAALLHFLGALDEVHRTPVQHALDTIAASFLPTSPAASSGTPRCDPLTAYEVAVVLGLQRSNGEKHSPGDDRVGSVSDDVEIAVYEAARSSVLSALDRMGHDVGVNNALARLHRFLVASALPGAAPLVKQGLQQELLDAVHQVQTQFVETPSMIAALSPTSVRILLDPSLTPSQTVRTAVHDAYYNHVRDLFNSNQRVLPTDFLCLFTRGALLTEMADGETAADSLPQVDTNFMKQLGFAVRANLQKWTLAEVFVFVCSLSHVSARLSVLAERSSSANGDKGRSVDAAALAAAHTEVNGILRECAITLAPFVKPNHTSQGDSRAPEPHGVRGQQHLVDTDDLSEPPSGQKRGAGSSDKQLRSMKKPVPSQGNTRFRFTPAEVLVLLQAFAACGVRDDDFVEHASERFSHVFRDVVAAGASAEDPNSGSGHRSPGSSPQALLTEDAPREGGPTLSLQWTTVADILSSLAMLEVRNQTAFLDAAPVVGSLSQQHLLSGQEPAADTVTRLLAAYAVMLVWNYRVVASLCAVAKQRYTEFTLEQQTIVQHALLRVNVRDEELTERYLKAIQETWLMPATRSRTLEVFQQDVGLLSAVSRIAFCLYEDDHERAGMSTILSHATGSGNEASSVCHVNAVVEDYNTLSYVPSPVKVGPLPQAREVARALADRIFDDLQPLSGEGRSEEETRVKSLPPLQIDDLSADEVAELLISLTRVHLFGHPLFDMLKRKSLDAILHVNSSLCLSQMMRAIALDAVVASQTPQQQQQPQKRITNESTEGTSRNESSEEEAISPQDAFFAEFFSLAVEETLRQVKQQRLSAASLAHILFSITIAGHRDDRLFITVLPKVRLLSAYGTFHEVGEIFYSYAKNNIWHQRLFAKLADRVIDLIKKENLLYKPQLLLMLESLTSIRFRYDKLFDIVAVRFLPLLHLCSLRDVCRLVHCYATLNYHASTHGNLQGDEGQCVATQKSSAGGDTASAVAAGGSIYDALYAACADRVVDLIREERTGDRLDLLTQNAYVEQAVRGLLMDLSDAGVRHEQLLTELQDVYPKMTKEFSSLQL